MKKRNSAAALCAAIPVCALVLMFAILLAGCSKNGGDESKTTGSDTPSQKVNVTAGDTSEDTAKNTTAGDTTPLNTADDTTDSAVQTPDPEPKPPVTQTPPPSPQVANAVEAAGETVTVSFDGGAKVVLGAADSDVIPALGTYKDKLEAPSCVHPGNDVLYFYNGYTVTTSPDASGKNIVTGVEITSDAVKLTNGVTVGSSEEIGRAHV